MDSLCAIVAKCMGASLQLTRTCLLMLSCPFTYIIISNRVSWLRASRFHGSLTRTMPAQRYSSLSQAGLHSTRSAAARVFSSDSCPLVEKDTGPVTAVTDSTSIIASVGTGAWSSSSAPIARKATRLRRMVSGLRSRSDSDVFGLRPVE